jgi:multidrug transporter EmrE-like cation transporter
MEGSDVYNAHWTSSLFVQHRRVLHEIVGRTHAPSPHRADACVFLVGAAFQTVAMPGEQMATTYIVVLGFEAITALFLSMLLLNESASLSKIGGLAVVVAGIVLLRSGKAQPAGINILTTGGCHEGIF